MSGRPITKIQRLFTRQAQAELKQRTFGSLAEPLPPLPGPEMGAASALTLALMMPCVEHRAGPGAYCYEVPKGICQKRLHAKPPVSYVADPGLCPPYRPDPEPRR